MWLQNKSIVVVGGCGFIGSHVVDELAKRQAKRIYVIDNEMLSTVYKIPDPKVHYYNLDIAFAPQDVLVDLFKDLQPDYVMNYAAMPYIPDCIQYPEMAFLTNTIGALKVIEAAHKVKAKKILQVTSAEVYGNEKNGSLDAPSTYATSKVATDFLARNRFHETGAPVSVLRQFNCVGPRETHPYVIPEIMSQISNYPEEEKEIVVELGNNTERDFMYVGDAASQAVDLIQKAHPGEFYDMGSQSTISIYVLAILIGKIMRPEANISIRLDKSRCRPVDIWTLRASNRKLYRLIGEQETTSIEEALQRTFEWYRNQNYDWGWNNPNYRSNGYGKTSRLQRSTSL